MSVIFVGVSRRGNLATNIIIDLPFSFVTLAKPTQHDKTALISKRFKLFEMK